MLQPDVCPVCGKSINTALIPDIMFCSSKCRDRHLAETRHASSNKREADWLLAQYESRKWERVEIPTVASTESARKRSNGKKKGTSAVKRVLRVRAPKQQRC